MQLPMMIDGGAVALEITCSTCNRVFQTELIEIPGPHFSGEKASDSCNETDDQVTCNCGEIFNVNIWSSFYDVTIEIVGDPEFYVIQTIDNNELNYFDDYGNTTDPHSVFSMELWNSRQILSQAKTIDATLQTHLLRMIASNGVTLLETYLLDTLLRIIIDPAKLKDFSKSFSPLKNMSFKLNEIYDKIDEIETIIKSEIYKIQFHNLRTVYKMYETVGVKFPPMGEMLKWIEIRHDLVHRNGKTKDGVVHVLTHDQVYEFLVRLEKFVNDIDESLIDSIIPN